MIFQEFHFSKYQAETDDGDIFKRITIKESIGSSSSSNTENIFIEKLTQDDIWTKDKDFTQNALYKGFMMYCHHKYYYKRWYMKIPDVLAVTLGMVNGLMSFLSIVNSFHNTYSFSTYLFHNNLLIDDEPKDVKNDLRNFFYFNKINEDKFENRIKKFNEILRNSNSNENLNNIDIINNNDNEAKMGNQPQCLNSKENLKNKMDFKKIIEKKIEKFNNKNKFNFNYFTSLKYKICASKNDSEKYKYYDIIDTLHKKFVKKMDIFHHLSISNKIEIFNKILLNDNKNFLKLITNKTFRIDLEDFYKPKLKNTQEVINEKILNDLLRCNENKLNKVDKNMINCFLG